MMKGAIKDERTKGETKEMTKDGRRNERNE
jgi:hypothetical protein